MEILFKTDKDEANYNRVRTMRRPQAQLYPRHRRSRRQAPGRPKRKRGEERRNRPRLAKHQFAIDLTIELFTVPRNELRHHGRIGQGRNVAHILIFIFGDITQNTTHYFAAACFG